MNVACYRDCELTRTLRLNIARYRFAVFVQKLGWKLAGTFGLEQDEFDSNYAIHVVATALNGDVIGYARLIPTTAPYLLKTHFARLLNGRTAPCNATVWEISRFTAIDPRNPLGGFNTEVGKAVLLASIEHTTAAGASTLVCCTSVAIERVARRWGFTMRRLGVPERHDNDLVIATAIHFDSETLAALRPELSITSRPKHRALNPAQALALATA